MKTELVVNGLKEEFFLFIAKFHDKKNSLLLNSRQDLILVVDFSSFSQMISLSLNLKHYTINPRIKILANISSLEVRR